MPENLKYDKENSWVKVEGNTATIGIKESAAKKVKEFVLIDITEKEKEIKKGDTYASVEAVKWSGHLTSPLSGKIVEVNDSLFDEPSKINKDPCGSWIIKLEISNKDELNELSDSEK
jgi:glycine cleavage system H protein